MPHAFGILSAMLVCVVWVNRIDRIYLLRLSFCFDKESAHLYFCFTRTVLVFFISQILALSRFAMNISLPPSPHRRHRGWPGAWECLLPKTKLSKFLLSCRIQAKQNRIFCQIEIIFCEEPNPLPEECCFFDHVFAIIGVCAGHRPISQNPLASLKHYTFRAQTR